MQQARQQPTTAGDIRAQHDSAAETKRVATQAFQPVRAMRGVMVWKYQKKISDTEVT